LRIGNSGTGRGGSYSAVQSQGATGASISQQEMIESAKTSADLGLPVRVADMTLARLIAANNPSAGVTKDQLDACAAIYPTGAWAWDTPTSGDQSVTGCVADVEIRMVSGTDDVVVARARIAPGDSIKCNISSFPTDGYTTEAGNVTFPADTEPTMEDVISVMNKEQKQNAGMKIAAATIIGGLAGNFVGQNDPGKAGALGTSSDKVNKTLIGAGALGGLTAISTQTGKVGGDVIMGATVNAIGGGLIGNISGMGNPVLLIRKCENTECLYGYVAKNTPICNAKGSNDNPKICDKGYTKEAFIGSKGDTKIICNRKPDASGLPEVIDNCVVTYFEYWDLNGTINQYAKPEDIQKAMKDVQVKDKFCLKDGAMKSATACEGEESFYKLLSAQEQGEQESAVIVGWVKKLDKYSDFKQWRKDNETSSTAIMKYRYRDGTIGQEISKDAYTIRDFTALTQDATDGSIIDLNNKARQNATITGASVGAGLGGFSSYQGAQTDIQNRWVAEVQAYKDSLTKVYCGTGKRYLSQYNEILIIPAK